LRTIDLHTHTTASDGTFTPTEIVDYAVQKKLSAIAITDHDTMAGIQEAIDHIRNSKLSLELIPGMEVSTTHPSAPYGLHILAFFIDKDSEEMADILTNFQNDIQHSSGNPRDAIALITKYGGVSVLAHPKDYFLSMKGMDGLVGELIPFGLQGLECIYTTHSAVETEQFKKIASRHGLLITGGTDFHGSRKPGVDLGSGFGNLIIPYEVVSALKKIAAAEGDTRLG